jgi:pSer/pThr/pTyr-binding forkhead associated (FHA) protein
LLSHCLAATSALRLPTAADLLQALLGVAESLGIAVGSVVPLTGSDTTAPSQPMLLIQERDVEPRSIVLPGNNLVIGRDANCDIVLQSKRVSRRHLRLEWDGQQCFLTDLDSANGTFLDGADLPINKPVVWPSQAAVRVGHVEIRLQLPETDE